jgi:hypothetical protein
MSFYSVSAEHVDPEVKVFFLLDEKESDWQKDGFCR